MGIRISCKMFTLKQKQRIVQFWYETYSYVEGRSGAKPILTPEKRRETKDSVVRSPKKSYRRRAQELSLSPTTLLRSMRNDLKLFPYRISTYHVLKDEDKTRRIEISEWLDEKLERSPGWLNNIWFSDEAHYHLNGTVNNHNNVFWGEEPPEEMSEKHLKGAKVTAWIAFNPRHGLLGPYWFQDGRGKTVIVNSERYCEIINKFNTELGQRFTVHQKSRMWFQQDGAKPHTAHDSLALLKELFGSRVISFRTTHEWAPHSPDLNPLDFWFWGASKGEVYTNKPTTLDQLKQCRSLCSQCDGGDMPQSRGEFLPPDQSMF
ncbi:histone-lysine N-methyltransferase SETMAR-like [Oratosquilla oratoria]|uniref:histone-lysine N-methyltransferase SETMAR-like n=1 Tax=Oratosquilla oratoria TaxID=337810 RepID=UPI003F771C84